MDAAPEDGGGSFLIVLIFNVVVFTIFMVFFLFYFRLKNSRVYFPKKKFNPIYRKPLNWIIPLLKTTDVELREQAGILAVLLCRYELYCALLCIIFTLLGLVLILPLNIYHGVTSPLFTAFSFTITTGTTIEAGSPVLWIHFFIFIIMLLTSYAALFIYHRKFLHTYKTQKQIAKVNFHTVKFRGIPKEIINGNGRKVNSLSSPSLVSLKEAKTTSLEEYEELKFKQGIKENNYQNNVEMKEFFENLFPQFANDILSVHIAYDLNKILELKQKKLENLGKLDRAEYQLNSPPPPSKENCFSSALSKCSKSNKKRNEVEHYSQKVLKISEKIKQLQKDRHESNNGIAFITFKSIFSAQQFIRVVQKYSVHLDEKKNIISRFTSSISEKIFNKVNKSTPDYDGDSLLDDDQRLSMQNPLIELMDEEQIKITQFVNSQNLVKAKGASLPEDILWQNLEVGKVSHAIRRGILSTTVLIVAFTWAIPIAILAAIATVATIPAGPGPLINSILQFLGTMMNTLVQTFLPIIGFMIINSVIHIVLYFVTRYERLHSVSTWDMSVMRNYFIFALFNNLIFPAIIMGGLSALAIQLANNDQADQPILGIHNINYSISATFFVNYIIFQTFLARTFMILQVPDYLSRYFKRKFAVTPREFEEANIFGLFPIWLAFDQSTIILGMVMSFTVIAPLIAPVGLVYFIVRFCADKTQLVAVKPKNTNTDCRTIPVLYLHFNLVVIWSEINVLIFFTIKQAPLLVLIMLFLIPATIFLMTLLLKNFKKSKRIAARDRAQLLESSFTEKELVNAYLHPALYPEPPDPLSPDIRFEDSRMFLQSPITSQIDREVLNPNDNIYDDVYEVRLNHN